MAGSKPRAFAIRGRVPAMNFARMTTAKRARETVKARTIGCPLRK